MATLVYRIYADIQSEKNVYLDQVADCGDKAKNVNAIRMVLNQLRDDGPFSNFVVRVFAGGQEAGILNIEDQP